MRRIKWCYYIPVWSGHGHDSDEIAWRVPCQSHSTPPPALVTCYSLPRATRSGGRTSVIFFCREKGWTVRVALNWMRTRTVYADRKSEPNQRGSSLPTLAVSFPRHRPVILLSYRDRRNDRTTGLAGSGVSAISVSSSTPTNWRLNSLIRLR